MNHDFPGANQPVQRYPIDNSAILHLAILQPGKANIFRFCADITETVDPVALQKAVDLVTPRFPVLVAGIQSDLWNYHIVPVQQPPKVMEDHATIAFMDMAQIRQCAMRVLYRKHQISVEFFHSLTDGYGALIFLRSLLAEYFSVAHGIQSSQEELARTAPRFSLEEESEDGFLRYAGGEEGTRNNTPAFQPGAGELIDQLYVTTGKLQIPQVLAVSRSYGVSMTTFLAAVMMESLRELQAQKRTSNHPIQIMVPVNLRKLFPCKTLHNFSLYALPRIEAGDLGEKFEQLLAKVDAQLKKQFTKEHLRSMFTPNVRLDNHPILRKIPLAIKCFFLRGGYKFFGGRTSSLSLSNLGPVQFPKEIEPYITAIGVHMSPRIDSAYNCGVISHGDDLFISFSRCSPNPELEVLFFNKLHSHGCTPDVETDDMNGDFSGLGVNVRMTVR